MCNIHALLVLAAAVHAVVAVGGPLKYAVTHSYSYPNSRYACSGRQSSAAQPDQLNSTRSPPGGEQNVFWNSWGGNIYNNRYVPGDSAINTDSVRSLNKACSISYPSGVSATPAVEGDIVYFPTWSGLFVALNYVTCKSVWEYNITALILDYAPLSASQLAIGEKISRTSPALDGDMLYFGTQMHALLVALNRNTGELIARRQINPHPFAIITMSPTVYRAKVYIGAASQEESAALELPDYACCSFIGNMASLQLDTGAGDFDVLWNVSMLPSGSQWSGASLWGGSPSIDVARQQVFVATGNVYTLPDAFEQCLNETANISVISNGLASDPCIPNNVYQESVLAFDLDTGFINWVRHLSPLDAWTAACGLSGIFGTTPPVPGQCPYQPGIDADFGMAPSFVPGSKSTPHGIDTLVIGQKNGNLYAMSAQAGTLFWATVTNPDGLVGGLSWGVAVDDASVYFTAINSGGKTFQLQPNGSSTSSSAFGAASLSTGSILWEIESPNGTYAVSPPTVVNDVVFFARADSAHGGAAYGTTPGGLIPVDKYSGKILADYTLTGDMQGGISVADSYVLFGVGYGAPYKGVGGIVIMKAD